MKRVPLYRAPLAGLISLALATTTLPATALTDPPPYANNPDDKDAQNKDDSQKKGKRVSREEQEQPAQVRLRR